MDSTRAIAGKGLFYVFVGQIVSLFTFIPFLGGFVGLAALVISIYGFYTMAKADNDYNTAFIVTIVNLVITLIHMFAFKSGAMNLLVTVANTLLSFLVVYYVCTATAALLQGVDDGLVNRAGLIWKMYLVCTVILIVCQILSYIPIINILAGIAAFLTAIVQLVASILYLIFLWSSQKTLQGK